MDTQLRLLTTEPEPDWKLDDATVAAGRQGIELARAALRRARANAPATEAPVRHRAA